MPALPTTTVAYGASATEAQFKSFLSDLRDYLAFLFGTDGTKATAISTLGASPFPAGTAMLFAQAAAPTGWTKSTTHNDKALRVVSGATGGSPGGSLAFSTVFSRTADDAATLSIAQMPSHNHIQRGRTNSGITNEALHYGSGDNTIVDMYDSTKSQGSGLSHSHGMDIRVQYVDVIIATKD